MKNLNLALELSKESPLVLARALLKDANWVASEDVEGRLAAALLAYEGCKLIALAILEAPKTTINVSQNQK